jgi:hypothetical protein
MNPRVVLLLFTTGLAALAAGCSSSSASNASLDTTRPVMPPSSDGDEDAGTIPVAPDGAVRFVIGSPLCNVTFVSCSPDNWAATTAKSCGLAPDGGAFNVSGGYDNAQLACHVERAKNSTEVVPTCTPRGTQTDTSSGGCTQPVDCKEGYECVSGGTCRPYCCGGECLSPGDFCDIQATKADPSLSVPVCMPIRSCALLDQPSDAGHCSSRQTCAVVRENGATGCVAVGGRQAGEECDREHCDHGLVCLGPSGQRRCYILCHTAPGSTECAATAKQTCLRSPPLFPVPGIGICE